MEIQEIKSRLSITTVLKRYHLTPDRNGMLKCPFHEDGEASLKVYAETNSFNCFGCEAGGDVIEFIQLKEECSKHEAIVIAKELVSSGGQVVAPPQSPPPSQIASEDTDREGRIALLTRVFGYFRGAINNSRPSRKYIVQARHLQLFLEIGYNSGQFHHGQRRDEDLIRECVKYGLLTPTQSRTKAGNDTGYYVFGKGCIVFPLKDWEERITGLYFRSISESSSPTGRHYYLKDREGLYPGYPGENTQKLILTEAVIDAATLLQLPFISGVHEILACYGTNGLTAEHSKAIGNLQQLKEVYIFFDGDDTGRKAAGKVARELVQIKEKVVVKIINTPEGEDVNSLLVGHDAEVYTHLLDSATVFSLTEQVPGTPAGHIKNISADTNAGDPVDLHPGDPSTPATLSETSESSSPLARLDTNDPEQLVYESGDMLITIWGGVEQENLSRLKVSMHVRRTGDPYRSFRDDVNLYSHSGVQKLVEHISEALEISTVAVAKTVVDLIEQLEGYRLEERSALIRSRQPKVYEMTVEEVQSARAFLKEKDLGRKTMELIQQSGLVGEQRNGLLLFLLYLSRLNNDPLHAIIFGKSGSGKTYLQTRVSECLPEESVRTITSLTENTLYYSARDFWKHKVLLIEDLEGVYNAFLPLREFMSKQSITKLTTDKDAKGNNIQKLLTVEGPICVSGATTQGSIYEDNANRSFLLHVDESSDHLGRVMDYQRRLQAGQVDETSQEAARQLLKNAQRLLRKVRVINPYAPDLRIPDCVFKKLRTNMHYLKLIEMITFYHQYQRKRVRKGTSNKEFCIETSLEDIALANWLVKDTLLRKSDELSEDTRSFFEQLKAMTEDKSRSGTPSTNTTFYAKEIRSVLRMHPVKVNRYLHQLESRGYINRRGGNRKTGYEYEILAWEEYEQLKSNIDILDGILEKIRGKYNGKQRKEEEATISIT